MEFYDIRAKKCSEVAFVRAKKCIFAANIRAKKCDYGKKHHPSTVGMETEKKS